MQTYFLRPTSDGVEEEGLGRVESLTGLEYLFTQIAIAAIIIQSIN